MASVGASGRRGTAAGAGCHILSFRYDLTVRRTAQTCPEGDVLGSEAVVLIKAEETFGSHALEWLNQRIDMAEPSGFTTSVIGVSPGRRLRVPPSQS